MEVKESNAPYIINLINSIIGVSVLAMPFCLKKCGLLLGVALLIGMSWLTYISCNMLVTAAVAKRRRTYEYLAFYTIGPTGKFAVELSMIGLMLGTCVAFYVIIGDLATAILQEQVDASSEQLRTYVIVFCALCIALPLGLMKNLSVLGFIGVFSMIFYGIFVCVMLANSISSGFFTFAWMEKVDFFRPAGVFQCLPIFSLAYACQCQLFVVYDSLEDASLMRMERIVTTSLKLVTFVYCTVAVLGYTTYIDGVDGNVLKNFKPDFILDLIKMGFAASVVVGFPLMIFPCRQSIHTLFFSQQPVDGVASKTYIEPFMFKAITLCIVLSTMMVALFIPNVETILGLTGATMGSFICFIFPGIIFTKASPKEETGISKFVLGIGCVLLVLCTYSNIYSETDIQAVSQNLIPMPVVAAVPLNPNLNGNVHHDIPGPGGDKLDDNKPIAEVVDSNHRHEPANPVAPIAAENLDKENQHLPDAPVFQNDIDQGQLNEAKQNQAGDSQQGGLEKINSQIEQVKESPGEIENQPDVHEAENLVKKDGDQEVEKKNNPLPLVKLEPKKELNIETKKESNDAQQSNIAANGIQINNPLNKEKVGNDINKVAQEEKSPIQLKQNEDLAKRDLKKSEKSQEDEKSVEKLAESIDEEQLLDQIKEHQKQQHELLHKEEALIKALEKKQNVQPIEKQNPPDSNGNQLNQVVNKAEKDFNPRDSVLKNAVANGQNSKNDENPALQMDPNSKILHPVQNNAAIQKPEPVLNIDPAHEAGVEQAKSIQHQEPNEGRILKPEKRLPPPPNVVNPTEDIAPNPNNADGNAHQRNSREVDDNIQLNQETNEEVMREADADNTLLDKAPAESLLPAAADVQDMDNNQKDSEEKNILKPDGGMLDNSEIVEKSLDEQSEKKPNARDLKSV